MTTKYYYFSGPCKWAKVYEPDDFQGERKWKIDVYLDKRQLKELKESGIKLKVREDEEGGKFVTFTRAMFKEGKDKNLKEYTPPRILAADSKTEITDLIGNGSEVTVKIETYDTSLGKGSRLAAVRVDKLVKFERAEEDNGERDF